MVLDSLHMCPVCFVLVYIYCETNVLAMLSCLNVLSSSCDKDVTFRYVKAVNL